MKDSLDRAASAPPADDLASPLEAAFIAVYESRDDGTGLKDAVCGFTDTMKAMGWPAERVIVELKRIASSADLAYRNAHLRHEHSSEMMAIVAEAVRWCIDRFYSDTKPKT